MVNKRKRRGKENIKTGDTNCGAGCRYAETPMHVIQHCHHTNGARISRHDFMAKYVADCLKDKGWSVEREISFRTHAGNRRPNMVATRDKRGVILDAQVVFSVHSLNANHAEKVRKYAENGSLLEALRSRYGLETENVSVAAITISRRGIFSNDSVRQPSALGLTSKQLFVGGISHGPLLSVPMVGSVMSGIALEWINSVGWTKIRFNPLGLYLFEATETKLEM